ncbi:MAG: HNH endonuclease [Bacteroidota bacterium]|nr:HNH endonuclease [Candidatus Kapabacteria bacterium]MCS7302849.1 HNH endonuclease [Candidatus Kapabacteria bacterium]MCX7936970.1 HNH endonuclease [Chlorobiota bacterium]MDW8075611.1 HNH endonuclease [Bacteroidota bacterium]MDW8272114.1 HNH endonuclease [Bacteroidota bacterium]
MLNGHHAAAPPLSSGRVLVLNQSYEPILICSVKKALLLLFLNKAELVESRNGAVIRSVRAAYPFPSVIRLHAYIHLPYKKVELSRRNILRRDGFACQYCGTRSAPLTIDHVIPRSRGGNDTWENLVTACIPCNNRKGNRTPEEAGMRLRSVPRKPNHIVFLRNFMGTIEQEWRPYLFGE